MNIRALLALPLFVYFAARTEEAIPQRKGDDARASGEQTKTQEPAQPPPMITLRDREVLDAVIRDLLDPNNPVHELNNSQKPHFPKEIILDTQTAASSDGDDTLDGEAEKRKIPLKLIAAWKRRNSADRVPTSRFKLANKAIKYLDLDAYYEQGEFQADTDFHDRYPKAVGWVSPYLPAFADDGLHAIAVVNTGPSIHGTVWVFQLELRDRQWKVVWRTKRIWE